MQVATQPLGSCLACPLRTVGVKLTCRSITPSNQVVRHPACRIRATNHSLSPPLKTHLAQNGPKPSLPPNPHRNPLFNPMARLVSTSQVSVLTTSQARKVFTPQAGSVDVATVNEEALEAATSSPTPDSTDEPFKLLPTETERLPLAYHHVEGSSPGLMFLPGFMSNMTSGKAMALEASAKERGQEFVRFDYHGHGSSGGPFEECTLGGWIENALDILDRVTSGRPMVLVGSSMGMWIAIHVALRRPDRVAGMIGIGAAPDFFQRFWLTLSMEDRESFEKDKLLLRQSPYSDEPYKIALDLITEARQHLILNNAENSVPINCPIRLLHGCQDLTAPPHLSSDIMNMVTSTDVEVTLVKNGDHRLSTPEDLDRMVRTVEELMRTIAAKGGAVNNGMGGF